MTSDTLVFVGIVFIFIQFQALTNEESDGEVSDSDRMFVLWCACGIFFNPLLGILGHVFSSYGLYSLLSILFYDFVIPMIGLVYFFIIGSEEDEEKNQNNNNE